MRTRRASTSQLRGATQLQGQQQHTAEEAPSGLIVNVSTRTLDKCCWWEMDIKIKIKMHNDTAAQVHRQQTLNIQVHLLLQASLLASLTAR